MSINLQFSTHEVIYLGFASGQITNSYENKEKLTPFSTSEFMQSCFNKWVIENFPPASFNLNQLDLTRLITSIWKTTRNSLEQTFKISSDQLMAYNERQWQQEADLFEEELLQDGRPSKVFTLRQIYFLHQTIHHFCD